MLTTRIGRSQPDGCQRVLVLTGFPAIGGPLPKLAPLMMDGFRRAGFDVKILGWSAHGTAPEPVWVKVRDRSEDLLRVARCIRAWRPDVLYVATAHNPPALVRDLPLAFATMPRHVPLVLHFHGSQSDKLVSPGHRTLKAASRVLVRRADIVLLLSHEERREWERFCPHEQYDVVVNPFVPAGRALATGAVRGGGEPRVFFVARLIPEKGCFDLLAAFAQVRARRPCRLVIAGRGPARDAILARAADLGVVDSLDLLGYVDGADLAAAYREADVFVLPSYFAEGFPLAVMEAMGYALPVITTRIRGCADHLEEGVNALFVPPHDPMSLAAALDTLLADGELREAMGSANAVKVDAFAPDRVMPAYVAALTSAMEARA
jgi:glycosyltransferase involved in cell wall biosynthesis